MYFIITAWLTLYSGLAIHHELNTMQFEDTWQCHEYVSENKMALLLPHIETYGDDLKGFEFYCENRWND